MATMRRGMVLLALLGGCDCDASDDVASEPEERNVAEPTVAAADGPTRWVPQVRPAHVDQLAWLDADRLLVTNGARVYVWRVSTGDVLSIDSLSWATSTITVQRGGALYGSSRWERATDTWHDLPPEVSPIASVISPDLDRVAEVVRDATHRELVVHDLDGENPVRVDIADAWSAFSPDGTQLVTCGEDGVALRDVATLTERRRWRGSSRGCVWEHDVLLSADLEHTVLLDARTLEPIGAPMPEIRSAAVSPDGQHFALAISGEREGISVREASSASEVVFREMPVPIAITIAGGRIAYSRPDPNEGTVGGVFDLEGHDVLSPRVGFAPQGLGPGGELAEIADGIVVVTTRDGETRRWEGAVDASIAVGPDALMATAGPHPMLGFGSTLGMEPAPALPERRAMRVDVPAFTTRTFGACPTAREAGESFTAARTVLLRDGAREALVQSGCFARDDGTSTAMAIEPVAGGRTVLLSASAESLDVVGLDATSRAQLRLDPREEPPCTSTSCSVPIGFSPDDALVVMARGPLLRAFDTRSGARVGRSNVAERTTQLLFLGDDRLVHLGADGVRTLFRLPQLAQIARWEGPPPPRGMAHPLHVVDAGILDTNGTTWSLRDAEGTVLATQTLEPGDVREGVRARGAVISARVGDEVRVYDASSLALLTSLAGTTLGVGPREIHTCTTGVVTRHRLEGTELRASATDAPCGETSWIDGGWVLVDGSPQRVIDPADRAAAIFVALEGDTVRVALVDDAGLHGDGFVSARRGSGLALLDIPTLGPAVAWHETR